MNQYLTQYFPADFLADYIEHTTDGLYRFRTYSIFRFLSSAQKAEPSLISRLKLHFNSPLTEDSVQVIFSYLAEDFYFSPSMKDDSFDPLFLYYAVLTAKGTEAGNADFICSLILDICPDFAALDFSDISTELIPMLQQETDFYGALTLLSCQCPALLSSCLPQFTAAYREELHFTCEDFILYNFMDEYFEIKNCRNNPKFQELINTLSLATLNAFDTTIEQCASSDGILQLAHPHSKFAGLCRFGALDLPLSTDSREAVAMMKHLLEYAVTYELRNNLFDFHLDEERMITLDNWKEKLKWYNVQYSNAYELALSSFYAASLSRKLLKRQFQDNLLRIENV